MFAAYAAGKQKPRVLWGAGPGNSLLVRSDARAIQGPEGLGLGGRLSLGGSHARHGRGTYGAIILASTACVILFYESGSDGPFYDPTGLLSCHKDVTRPIAPGTARHRPRPR